MSLTGCPTPRTWPISTIAGSTSTELRQYPITLGFGQPRTVRGRPLLADPALGRKIIEGVGLDRGVAWRIGCGAFHAENILR